jgi:uncharacterized protein YbjT (DUF2867 family)
VSQLLGTGAAVRALTRNPDSAGLPDGVDVARADLSVPDTLDACLDGVAAVFLVWPFLTADLAPAVLDVVTKHAHRIVYLSSAGVRDDLEQQTDPINQFHADIERLIEQSGLEWTFLRSGGFATNTLWWAPQIRADGVVRGPYGAAVRSLIHERDIAAVVVRALTGDGHGGVKYLLTGPQLLTQVEQVHTIGEAIGRPLRWEGAPPRSGGPARGRAAADAHRWLATLGRGWHPQRPRQVRDGTGAGDAHGRSGHRCAGAHVPRMGDRPHRRLPLNAHGRHFFPWSATMSEM